MTDGAAGGTSLRMWLITLAVVFAISFATYSAHRYLVNKTVAEAAPIRAKREAERKAFEDEKTRGREDERRVDTLTSLLKEVEKVLETRPLDSLLVIRAANIAYDLEDFEKSEKYYRRYLNDIDKTSISARIDLAYVVFRNGKQSEGMNMLKDVLRRDPRNQMAMFNLAFMFDQTGDKKKAKEWIVKCMKVDSTTTLGHNAKQILNSE